jgi:hypothetical protein
MMKKILALLLALLMLCGLCACEDLGNQISNQASEQLDQMLESVFEDDFSTKDTGNTTVPTEPSEEATQPTTEATEPPTEAEQIAEDGWYYSKDEVALYLYTYSHLPDNFITKAEASALGWEGGSVQRFQEGAAIGGDKFGNREGILPKASGRQYYECDIDTDGKSSRGAKRIVFSNDGLIYYTEDHYETFTLLYGEE